VNVPKYILIESEGAFIVKGLELFGACPVESVVSKLPYTQGMEYQVHVRVV
jgi:hypothetical protein